MFCPECGSKNKDGSKYCHNCGTYLGNLIQDVKECEIEEFSLKQRRYVKKICEDIFSRFCLGREIEKADYYENAKLYEMTKEQVDCIFNQYIELLKKIYDYIDVEVAQIGDFDISESALENIYEYGSDLEVSEDDIQHIVEKYETDHRLAEKQELYKTLFKKYINDEKQEEVSSSLSSEEQEVVAERFKRNIKEINQLIEEEYSKIEGTDLKKNQMLEICEKSHNFGFTDSKEILSIITKYQDEHGITEEKRRQEECKFCKIVGEAYSREIVLFGEKEIVDGCFFFKSTISNELWRSAKETGKKWDEISDAYESSLGEMAHCISEYGSNTLEVLKNIEEKVSLLEVTDYFIDIKNYIVQKLADICAVNEACQNIDSEVDMEARYREARKNYRSRWSGGGFGLSGAIKGAMTAGVLNMGSGALHSAINAVGNAGTKHRANKQKRKLIGEIKRGVSNEIENLTEALIKSIFDYIDSSYPNAFSIKNKKKENELYEQFLKATGKEKIVYIRALLKQNPYEKKYYIETFNAFSSKDMKAELIEIGEQFNVNDISKILDEFIDEKIAQCFTIRNKESLNLLYKWIDLKYSDLADEEVEQKYFEIIEEQLCHSRGDELEQIISSLQEYYGQSALADKCAHILESEIEHVKQLIKNMNHSTVVETEEAIDYLIVLGKVGGDKTKADIDILVDQFAKKKMQMIEDNIDIYDVSDTCQKQDSIQGIQMKYGILDPVSFKRILEDKIDKEMYKKTSKESLFELKKVVLNLSEKTGVDLANKELNIDQLIKVELQEEKTVYDYCFNCNKIIESRKPVLQHKLEGILFDTAENADKMRKKVKEIEKIYERCKISSYDSVDDAISSIKMIYEETGFGKDVLKVLSDHLYALDIQRRTVLGTLYATVEEAESEREKVVGNRKFETKEAAKKERERLQMEKELEQQEKEVITKWESQKLSPIEILKNLLEKNYRSKSALDKRKEYSNKVFNIYSSLKAKNISIELAKLRTKQILFTIIGIIAILIAIRPFFAVGLIGKIIIFILVLCPWGAMMQARDNIPSYEKEQHLLEYIESVFDIKGNDVFLKKVGKTDSKSQSYQSKLVEVRVIEKYKDIEKGKIFLPGDIIEVSLERANKLIESKVVEKI